MRVLAWVPQEQNQTPGQRFRMEQWTPHLAARGIRIEFSSFASPELGALLAQRGRLGAKVVGVAERLFRRIAEAVTVARPDLVYVFREGALLGPAWAERLLRLRRIPFVFDFDDSVWIRYLSPTSGTLSYLRCAGKTATLCRRARHVMAGNDYLRQYAERYNPRVTVVPTTIDTDRYRLRPSPGNRVPVIGWSGSLSTVQYLDALREPLAALRRRLEFRVRVVGGGTGFAVPGVDVECVPWRSETETGDLACFDVGVMPLPDTEWARGKCGLKALQYMALGIPAVVSPVGVNAKIVDHERNGLLAASPDQWMGALERLLTDGDLRRRLGEEGRRTVEEGYSARVIAPVVARIFEEAAA